MTSPFAVVGGAPVARRHAPEPPPASVIPAPGLQIGYLLPAEGRALDREAAALRRAGCASIRTESSAEGAILAAVLAFLAEGDRLILPSVRHLPSRFGGLERLLNELDARGAEAVLLAERLSTTGEEGRLLRRAVSAAAGIEPPPPRPRPTAAVRARARALAAGGTAPGEIARELRVSRMTIWRWLNRD